LWCDVPTICCVVWIGVVVVVEDTGFQLW
jgi:hypothetical protein